MKEFGNLVLDTNAVIAYREDISQVCNSVDNADILFLPAPVLGELLYGAANSNKPKKNEKIVREFLAQCVFMPIDETVTSRYASVRLKLKKSGHPIPENDIWIAAIALELDTPILTNDIHFDYVSRLNVIKIEE